MTVEEALARLKGSKFRGSFHLSRADKAYFQEKGEAVIRRHAEDFVRQKLAPAEPANDGRQTPMSGHPAFKAMHATACCCRGCFEKWYKVPRGRELTPEEQQGAVRLIMAWCEKEMKS